MRDKFGETKKVELFFFFGLRKTVGGRLFRGRNFAMSNIRVRQEKKESSETAAIIINRDFGPWRLYED